MTCPHCRSDRVAPIVRTGFPTEEHRTLASQGLIVLREGRPIPVCGVSRPEYVCRACGNEWTA